LNAHGVKNGLFPVIQSLVLAVWLHAAEAATPAESTPNWTKVAEQALPAIVQVDVAGEKPTRKLDSPFFDRFVGQTRPHNATGSGFIIGADGHVLAAASVFANANRIFVTLQNGTRHPARMIGRDELLDIALLKIDGVSNLPFLQWQSDKNLRMGVPVASIGYPFSLGATLTTGVVSATQRRLPDQSWVPYVQTSVLIERGHAGSPLLDANGRVVGVFSVIYTSSGSFSGISLAVPADLIQPALVELKTSGSVSRPQAGLTAFEEWHPNELEPPQAQHLRVVIESVLPGSPAEQAGLKTGDVVTRYGDNPIHGFADLAMYVALSRPGMPYSITVLRDGKPLTLSLTPALPHADKKPADAENSGWPLQDSEAGNSGI